jgi:regulator of ribonuclease activity A
VRDVAELRELSVGIMARSSVPMPTERRGQGLADVPVRLMGQWVHPGDWLYADEDGILLSKTPLL